MKEKFYVQPVQNFKQFYLALRVVHDEYCRAGLMEAKASGLRFFLRDILPASTTLVASTGENILGTATAQLDSRAGLPADPIYPDKMAQLRQEGRIVLESTKFACPHTAYSQPSGLGNMSVVGARMLKALFMWCQKLEVHDWVIVVHPRVQDFYREMLGFEILASERECAHVRGKPGVMMRLRVKEILDGQPGLNSSARNLFLTNPPIDPLNVACYTPSLDEIATLVLDDISAVCCASFSELASFSFSYHQLESLIQEQMASRAKAAFSTVLAMSPIYKLDNLPQGADEQGGAQTPFALRAVISTLISILEIRANLAGVMLECKIADDVPDAIIANQAKLLQLFAGLVEECTNFAQNSISKIQVEFLKMSHNSISLIFSTTCLVTKMSETLHRLATDLCADIQLTRVDRTTDLHSYYVAVPVVPFSDAIHLTSTLAHDDFDSLKIEQNINRLNVLIVEDSAISAVVTRRLLQRMGHTVTINNSGQECLSSLKSKDFDLILMDIQMPGLNGFETTQLIRQQELTTGAYSQIYALSAMVMKEDRDRCLAIGMDGYLKKPIVLRDLQEALTRVAKVKQINGSLDHLSRVAS
jgi:CheY-like chemotaxis protein